MSERRVVVCLPDRTAGELAAPLPSTVSVLAWDGAGAPPAGVGEVEFWVPTYMTSDPVVRDRALSLLRSLRVIQLVSAGADPWAGHVPDGVTLCDGRGVHGGSTSEWVLTAMLAALREFPRFVRAQVEHRWDPVVTDELAGKRVLVVGAGDLGQNVARRVRAFDAVPTLVARTAREDVRGVADLPQLLPEADVVVVVIPLTAETTRLVDAAFLAAMPDGALLVNAARGPITDTDALLAELHGGRLHAALDVVDPEPLPADHPLWDAPNLLLTPHVGGGVRGFPARAYRLVREQVERYVAGEQLLNVVSDGY
jgi:phosphoglycerate dehydrogenase-like enzyme